MVYRRHALIAAACALSPVALACVEPALPESTSHSLEGTETDGELRTGGDGYLVVDRDTQWLFDYFLTREDEASDEVIRAEVAAEAYERLDPAAARHAVELFDAYAEFRREAAEVGRDEDITLDQAAHRLRDAHARHLGDEDGFAGELAHIDRAVAVAHVLNDDDLDQEAKAVQLAAMMPVVASRAVVPAQAHGEVRQARARGADEAEVFAIRAEMLGAEAAGRLAALDEQRREWDARVEAYRRDAQQVHEAIADDAGRLAALEALRAERFTEIEARRLAVLEGAATLAR